MFALQQNSKRLQYLFSHYNSLSESVRWDHKIIINFKLILTIFLLRTLVIDVKVFRRKTIFIDLHIKQ